MRIEESKGSPLHTISDLVKNKEVGRKEISTTPLILLCKGEEELVSPPQGIDFNGRHYKFCVLNLLIYCGFFFLQSIFLFHLKLGKIYNFVDEMIFHVYFLMVQYKTFRFRRPYIST
jgi:hypothetical protein